MKTKVLAGLLFVLVVGFIPVLADDNPDQAAARAALVKKLFELNQPQIQTPPRWDSGAMVVRPDKSTNEVIEPVATKTEPPQTTPAATSLPAAPAKEVPVALPSAIAVKPTVVPTSTQPSAAPPATLRTNLPPVVKKTPSPVVKPPPANDLVTTTGAVYKEARVEKVEADGLIVSYVPAGGGMAMTKVFFEDLPSQLRQQYEKKKEVKH